MVDRPVPKINYDFVPSDGQNMFSKHFGHLSDEQWGEILLGTLENPKFKNINFPLYPETELQNRIHGGSGAHAVAESLSFYHFVKENTYKSYENTTEKRFLDFGCGWGRISRPFMRDFKYSNLFGFEPDFLFCTIARSLNYYMTIFSGDFVPTQALPENYFDVVVGWSIFSHLSEYSATLWLEELARVTRSGAHLVFTTWGLRFLERLKAEVLARDCGKEIHWYSSVCIAAAGSIEERIDAYKKGEFVWFTGGKSQLYGEAFVGEAALQRLIQKNELPFTVVKFDTKSLGQDAFILLREPALRH